MPIFNLYSKRMKVDRGEVPDVYQYNTFEQPLKVQIVHIITDAFGNESHGEVIKLYQEIVGVLCREYGVFELLPNSQRYSPSNHLLNYFLQEKDNEKSFDVIELCFRVIDNHIRDNYYYVTQNQVKIKADDAINELNERFQEHAFGYKYESGIILKITSEYTHKEIVKPALTILNNHKFAGAQQEFLSAHSHYRNKENKECMNDCLKSFESTIKVVLNELKISYEPNATSKALISLLFSNGYIPTYLQSNYNGLQSILESGVPTLRNKLSGHGQGSKVIDVDDKYVEYILNLTATSIVFLASGIS